MSHTQSTYFPPLALKGAQNTGLDVNIYIGPLLVVGFLFPFQISSKSGVNKPLPVFAKLLQSGHCINFRSSLNFDEMLVLFQKGQISQWKKERKKGLLSLENQVYLQLLCSGTICQQPARPSLLKASLASRQTILSPTGQTSI